MKKNLYLTDETDTNCFFLKKSASAAREVFSKLVSDQLSGKLSAPLHVLYSATGITSQGLLAALLSLIGFN